MKVRERFGGWLEGHRVIGGVLGLLYYLWAIALFMAVLEMLERLFPWTFLGEQRLLGAVGLFVTLLLWVLANRIVIGRWVP